MTTSISSEYISNYRNIYIYIDIRKLKKEREIKGNNKDDNIHKLQSYFKL